MAAAIFEILLTLSKKQSPELGGAIGELLLVIVLGIGEVLAFFALRHAAKEREFSCWLKAQEIWTEPGFRDKRGQVFRRLQTLDLPWTGPDKQDAMEVIRRMDEFARIIPYLGAEKVLDTFDDPIGKAWLVLEPLVMEERTANAQWATKWDAFAQIGREALAKLVRENRDPRRGQFQRIVKDPPRGTD